VKKINLKKSQIRIGSIILGFIVLIGSLYYFKVYQSTHSKSVENQDYKFEKLEEYQVSPLLWAKYIYGNEINDFEQSKISYIFQEYPNEYFSNNFNLLGKKIPDGIMLSNAFEESTNVSLLKNNRVIILTNLKDTNIMENIEDYLILKETAKDMVSYGVYIVDYNEDEKKDFFKKVKDGYVLTNRDKEVNDFMKTINKNIILFVDKNNVIQSAMDYAQVTNLSMMSMYAFTGDVSIKDYIKTFNEAITKPKETTKIFLTKKDATKTYKSIEALNLENNFSFFSIKGISKNFVPKNIELINRNVSQTTYINESIKDKIVTVKQMYGATTFDNEATYTYNNQYALKTTFFNVYGKNKNDLYAFKIIRNNITIFLESTTPINISEIESIINGSF